MATQPQPNYLSAEEKGWIITRSDSWPLDADGNPVKAVGQPGVIRLDLTLSAGREAYLQVEEDTEVVVLDVKTQNNQPFWYVAIRREQDVINADRGWIEPEALLIGPGRAYNDLHTIVASCPRWAPTNIAPDVPGITDTRFFNALVAFLGAVISVKYEALDLIAPILWDYMNQHTVREVASQICEAVNSASPALFEVFNRPHFTLDDIMSHATKCPTNRAPYGHHFYFLVYENIRSNVQGENEEWTGLYAGETVEPISRRDNHRHKWNDAKSKPDPRAGSYPGHYATAKHAKKQTMFLAARFQPHEERKPLTYILEQSLVALFDTSLPWIKSYHESTTWQTTYTSISHSKGSLIVPEDSGHMATGSFFRSIAQSVLPTAGWGFHSQRIVGLNQESPLGNIQTSSWNYWTRIELADRFVFQRPNVTVLEHSSGFGPAQDASHLINIANYGTICLPIGLPQSNIGPEVGTKVTPIVEVMKNNVPHDVGYARLPTIGRLIEHDRCRSLAIAVAYKDGKGGWLKMWLQNETGWRYRTDDDSLTVPNMHSSLSNTLALLRHLFQEPITNPIDNDKNLGCAKVYDATYKHLSQDVELTEVYPQQPQTLTHVDANGKVMESIKTRQQIINELAVIFGRADVDLPVGTTRGAKRSCDFCYIASEKGGKRTASKVRTMGCIDPNHAGTCLACRRNGMPCTYSLSSQLRENTIEGKRRRDAVAMQLLQELPPFPIANPRVLTLGQPNLTPVKAGDGPAEPTTGAVIG